MISKFSLQVVCDFPLNSNSNLKKKKNLLLNGSSSRCYEGTLYKHFQNPLCNKSGTPLGFILTFLWKVVQNPTSTPITSLQPTCGPGACLSVFETPFVLLMPDVFSTSHWQKISKLCPLKYPLIN